VREPRERMVPLRRARGGGGRDHGREHPAHVPRLCERREKGASVRPTRSEAGAQSTAPSRRSEDRHVVTSYCPRLICVLTWIPGAFTSSLRTLASSRIAAR
jgi:hypothetical protein